MRALAEGAAPLRRPAGRMPGTPDAQLPRRPSTHAGALSALTVYWWLPEADSQYHWRPSFALRVCTATRSATRKAL